MLCIEWYINNVRTASGLRSGIASSVRIACAAKWKGPVFKSRPFTVDGPVNIIMWARLKTSFELHPVTEGK